MKLEDQLKEAERVLAEKKALLAQVIAEDAEIVAKAEAELAAAKAVSDAADATYAALKHEHEGRLGLITWDKDGRRSLTPEFHDAVLAWAGLQPGEEHEAISRGKDSAANAAGILVRRIVESVPAVAEAFVARDKARKVLHDAQYGSGRLYSGGTHKARERARAAERQVLQAQDAMQDARAKITKRDMRRDAPDTPVEKPKVEARHIEARRRLGAVEGHGTLPREFEWKGVVIK